MSTRASKKPLLGRKAGTGGGAFPDSGVAKSGVPAPEENSSAAKRRGRIEKIVEEDLVRWRKAWEELAKR